MSKGIVWVRKLPFAVWKKDAAKALSSFIDEAAVEGVNFFKGNFDRQSFLNEKLEWWVGRKNDKTPGRKILIGPGSGRLKRSVRKVIIGMTIKWVSDVPYAKIHNEGGTISATQSVRAHVRKIASRSIFSTHRGETGRRSSKIKIVKSAQGIAFVKAHSRTVNTKIPQRRFIGYSVVLMDIISNIYQTKMKRLFTSS
jgi:phage gpG-like protein